MSGLVLFDNKDKNNSVNTKFQFKKFNEKAKKNLLESSRSF